MTLRKGAWFTASARWTVVSAATREGGDERGQVGRARRIRPGSSEANDVPRQVRDAASLAGKGRTAEPDHAARMNRLAGDAAIAFLNTYNLALEGRPLDLAVASEAGYEIVEDAISAKSIGD